MDEKIKYFKGRYMISFYDKTDNWCENIFNNIHEICAYRKLENSAAAYNLVKIELYRALRRPDHRTTMLNGKVQHVWLIDIFDNDDEL